MIVWEKYNHNFSIYRDLGRFNVTRTNDYVTIRDKGIGGTIVNQANNQILLDTGIIITKHALKEHTPFANLAKKFVKDVQYSAATEMAETKFIENLWVEDAKITHLSHSLCKLNKEIRRIQSWILKQFPGEA